MIEKDKLDKRARLELIYKKLDALPPCQSTMEAIDQITSAVNYVEDNYTTLPAVQGANNARIYPPLFEGLVETDNPNIKAYRHAQHNSFVGSNGSFKFQIRYKLNKLGPVTYSKRGADGREIDEL